MQGVGGGLLGNRRGLGWFGVVWFRSGASCRRWVVSARQLRAASPRPGGGRVPETRYGEASHRCMDYAPLWKEINLRTASASIRTPTWDRPRAKADDGCGALRASERHQLQLHQRPPTPTVAHPSHRPPSPAPTIPSHPTRPTTPTERAPTQPRRYTDRRPHRKIGIPATDLCDPRSKAAQRSTPPTRQSASLPPARHAITPSPRTHRRPGSGD